MKNIKLLDCTLRDGGYINDWDFGANTIKWYCEKIAETGVEMFEIGFIKGDTFNPNRAVFPNVECISEYIAPKNPDLCYVGMIDMNSPIPIERIPPYSGLSVDAIRVIFKKDKQIEAFEYCRHIKKLGYKLFVNFVATNSYSDTEFVESIRLFNRLEPYAMSIVDTFGLIKRKQFLRLVFLADNNMLPGIALCYHAHNNLQQAMGNAEALVEQNIKRPVCIDACVFGMGRGAGNLNLELFADYMNENYDTQYRITPMLEIMDECLSDIYRRKFWGYSLPLYLSATTGCHPNYAIYLAEKNTLTVKSFHELLCSIPENKKNVFSQKTADEVYGEYQNLLYDDTETLNILRGELEDKRVLLLAPGSSVLKHLDELNEFIRTGNVCVIALNFTGGVIKPHYIFSSNLRRYSKIADTPDTRFIITSNIHRGRKSELVLNYASYTSSSAEIVDNSGLMALRMLIRLGLKSVWIAGMDGYSSFIGDYVDQRLAYCFAEGAARRNSLISQELQEIGRRISLQFLTETYYIL